MQVPPENYLEIHTHIEKVNSPIFNWNKGKTISKWFWEVPEQCSINPALDTAVGKISELSVAFHRQRSLYLNTLLPWLSDVNLVRNLNKQ